MGYIKNYDRTSTFIFNIASQYLLGEVQNQYYFTIYISRFYYICKTLNSLYNSKVYQIWYYVRHLVGTL